MIKLPYRSLCVVVSAPSGGGKTTLCERLLAEFPEMAYSVSCTTRQVRPGEVDGKDYVFLKDSEFLRGAESGEFIEYAKVHGYWYGTRRRDVENALKNGRDVLLDIDVQGAENIRNEIVAAPESLLHKAFIDVFIMPPNMAVLEARLRGRKQDQEEVIQARLRNAEYEIERWKEYRYVIVNDCLDEAFDRFRSIIVAEHSVVNSG